MEIQKIRKTYSELIKYSTFIERFRYLKLNGIIGKETFGFERYLNQVLYQSDEWRRFRNEIIIRDNGCDLGVDGFSIFGGITIHHLNPITKKQIIERDSCIFDPENVITTRHSTHMAIHYGSESGLEVILPERKPNDTCPWKH